MSSASVLKAPNTLENGNVAMRLDVGAVGVAGRVHRAGAAHGEQHELARIVPGGERADAVHLLAHDAVDQALHLPGASITGMPSGRGDVRAPAPRVRAPG